MKFYVYAHCDEAGLVKYVGRGSGDRAWKMVNRPSYWLESFPNRRPAQVRLLEQNLDHLNSFRRERAWMEKLKSEGHPVANKDIAKPWLGKKRDPELMRRMSAASQSPESKEKRAAHLRGKPLTRAHREAIRAGLQKKRIICVETGAVYASINEAARAIGVGCGRVSEVVNGIRKTCNGFSFKRES